MLLALNYLRQHWRLDIKGSSNYKNEFDPGSREC